MQMQLCHSHGFICAGCNNLLTDHPDNIIYVLFGVHQPCLVCCEPLSDKEYSKMLKRVAKSKHERAPLAAALRNPRVETAKFVKVGDTTVRFVLCKPAIAEGAFE